VDLARQDVHDAGVPEDEVGRDGAPGRCDEVAEGQGPGEIAHAPESVRQTVPRRDRLGKTEAGLSTSFPIRDPQSGAYTRAFFDEIVDREVERSRRHGSVLSVLSIVLANWSDVTCAAPVSVVDDAIRTVAITLFANLRMTDYLFRWEDDEFLALLVEANLDGCKLKVARLAETFRPWREGKGPLPQRVKVRVGAGVLGPGLAFPAVLHMSRQAARDTSGEMPVLRV
jgi:diguanylate cyclase (GGDEF)-like protein